MKLRRATLVDAWLLAALLLLAQGLGYAHRVLHAPGSAAPNWAQGHESGATDCRLIDQLAHADALCGGQPAVAELPTAADTAVAPSPAAVLADAPAAYLARAPPH